MIQDKKKEDKAEKTSIEELIEQKRAELGAQNKTLTPVNLQTFVAWKKRKLREKADAEKKENENKKKKMKDGLTVGMSGRDMFLFDPKMVSNEVSFAVYLLKMILKVPCDYMIQKQKIIKNYRFKQSQITLKAVCSSF